MRRSSDSDNRDDSFDSLVHELAEGRLTRRDFAARAAAAGLSLPLAASLIEGLEGTPSALAAPAAREIRRGGTLRIADPTGGTHDTLDPATYQTALDAMRIKTLYDTLVDYHHNFKTKPRLAASWQASSRYRVWTFYLQKNARWHDGRPVTAQDVVFTFRRLLDPQVGATIASTLSVIDPNGIRALNAHTVRFHLKSPYVDFPALLALDGTQIVRSDFDPKTANTHPIGSGPFRFQSFTPGTSSTWVKNPNYFRKGYPYVDKLQISDIFDESARNSALLSGQIDFASGIEPSSARVLKASGAKVFAIPGGTFIDITLVSDMAPFHDVRVRRAFALAIDRPQIVRVVFQGHARVGNDQPISHAYPYAPTIPQRTRNIPLAKKLLAEAGYRHGIDLTLYTTEGGFGMENLAVAVADQVKAAGIRVKVQKWPGDSYWSQVWLKKNFYTSWWTGRSTPDILLSTLLVSNAKWNEPHFRNKKFDSLIARARATGSARKRRRLYTEAMTMVHDSASWIIPAYIDLLHGARKNFHFQELPPPISNIDFSNAWLS